MLELIIGVESTREVLMEIFLNGNTTAYQMAIKGAGPGEKPKSLRKYQLQLERLFEAGILDVTGSVHRAVIYSFSRDHHFIKPIQALLKAYLDNKDKTSSRMTINIRKPGHR